MPLTTSVRDLVSDLEQAVTTALGTKVSFTKYENTYEVANDMLKLTVSIEDTEIQIHSLKIHGYQEAQSDAVDAIQECAADYGYGCCARNVRDDSALFWLNKGYEESDEFGTYRRESL
jgi:hypothetical protein